MGGSFRLMDGGFPKVTRRIKGYLINDKLGGTFVEGVIGERGSSEERGGLEMFSVLFLRAQEKRFEV